MKVTERERESERETDRHRETEREDRQTDRDGDTQTHRKSKHHQSNPTQVAPKIHAGHNFHHSFDR